MNLGGCKFETATPEEFASDEPDLGGGSDRSGAAQAAPGAAGSLPTTAVGTGRADAAAGGSAGEPASGNEASQPADPAAADSGMQAAASSPTTDAGSPSAGGSGQASAADDAGTSQADSEPLDAGDPSQTELDQCSLDLAQCIIEAPLDYAGCLRANAANGCPPPDAGTPTAMTTPVLDENGVPISQVCQAELAKCIMELPTPEHAMACTETARTCE